MSATHASYRPDIDGLRAISVGVVVAFHAWFRQGFGGFVGVDVFFVISGYLISGILLRDLESGRFSFAGFYARRVRRIYPALVLVLAATLAAGWVQLFDEGFHHLGRHVAAAAAFVSNLVLYGESGYFDAASDGKPLLHLWSLGVEEQFYILWPLVLALAWRVGQWRGVGAALGLGLIASLGHEQMLMRRDVSAAFYIPTARFWEMLAGAGLAAAERHGRWRPSRALCHGLGVAGLALLLASLGTMSERTLFPGLAALIPVGGAVALIAAGPEGWVNARLLSWAPMRWLGGISYPLYLWHWPVLVLVRTSGWGDGAAMLGAVCAAVALAWATARWIEPPLRYGGRRALWALLAAMAVLGGLGLAVDRLALPTLTSRRVEPIARQLRWTIPVGSDAQGQDCSRMMVGRSALVPGLAGNDFCYLQRPGAPDVALIGDSMNLSLFPGLARYGDYNLLLAAASEAAPFYDTTTTESFDRTRIHNWKLTNQALDFALASPTIRVVVLSYANGDQLLDPASAHSITDHADTPPASPQAMLERVMRRTLLRLTRAGKRVILALPVSRMGFDPGDCLTALRPIHGPAYRHPCGEPRGGDYARRRETYDRVARAVAAQVPGVVVVDLAPPLCDARLCYALRGGEMYYRDTLHLSEAGSRAVAPVLHGAIMRALAR